MFVDYLPKRLEQVSVLKKLDHPSIMKLVEVLASDNRIFLVFELVEGGMLFDRIGIVLYSAFFFRYSILFQSVRRSLFGGACPSLLPPAG